ncbi:hypothetical protein VP1G_08432 [Cytospora mali]|uniref:Uncharacterized protein n=1 Tax=Cytospora mali TaxID=578113 RepID=A0A194VBJ3_CYTMA|nr:hypothetical protein VP1G_08432 [Valsa mali var. pyri (nom. inval.)]
MVGLDKVRSSNDQISTDYPEGLVAVFAGSTSGIGETSLREFARHAAKPRIYIIGRSQEACDRLDAELKQINPAAQYIFIRSDISSKETAINVLFMSQGTLNFTKRTEEGLNYLLGLSYFGRIRMARNLLPLLQQATGLRRVVSTLTGTKEGKIYEYDWQGDKGKVPMSGQRKHGATMMTLGLEALASLAPGGTNIVRGDEGGLAKVVGYAFKAMSLVACGIYTPVEEVGQRHLFYSTSARYPPRIGAGLDGGQGASGVALPSGVSVARGVDGEAGSGVYSVDEHGESANAKVEELLASYRKSGTGGRLWAYTESEWKRLVSSAWRPPSATSTDPSKPHSTLPHGCDTTRDTPSPSGSPIRTGTVEETLTGLTTPTNTPSPPAAPRSQYATSKLPFPALPSLSRTGFAPVRKSTTGDTVTTRASRAVALESTSDGG